jgi:hypothetical protein
MDAQWVLNGCSMDAEWMLNGCSSQRKKARAASKSPQINIKPHICPILICSIKLLFFLTFAKKIIAFVAYLKKMSYLCTRNECEGTHWPFLYSMAMLA